MNARVHIVSIGNRLVGDDAVGPIVHDALAKRTLPADVQLTLLGVGGIAMLDELHRPEHLIVIDAVRWGTPAGTVHVTDDHSLRNVNGMPVTSHDIGIEDVLRVGEKLFPEKMPQKTTFIGVEGRDFDELGTALSASVAASVPKVVEIVLSLIGAPRTTAST